jgi:gluconolactonase
MSVSILLALSACGATAPPLGAPAADDAAQEVGSGAAEVAADAGPDGPPVYPALDFSQIGAPRVVGGQFMFTEGPIWDPAKQVLYFTDIGADAIYQFTPPDTFVSFWTPSQNADGLALDMQGDLVAAGFAARNVWRANGQTAQTLAASYAGKALNSPDDLVIRSDGTLYFTDPLFGIDGSMGLPAQTQEQDAQGVYRVTPGGEVHSEDDTTDAPNGINLSPDEGTLYVSSTNAAEVYAFSVAEDGALGDKRVFASDLALADSMCVDAGGNVYVATLTGLAVLDPDGVRLGTVALDQVPTNCAFGGPDQRTLFITARTLSTGAPPAGGSSVYAIDDMPIPGMAGRP